MSQNRALGRRWLKRFFVTLVPFLAIPITSLAQSQNVLPGNLRSIVYHNAPFYIQEAAKENDQIWPVDYDGDLIGHNNLGGYISGLGELGFWVENNDSLDFNLVAATPKIYYSVVETGYGPDDGYYLIGYYDYHARDDGFIAFGANWSGHQHDMEGVWLVIKKSSFAPYGTVVAGLTEAHGALIPYHTDAVQSPWMNYPQGGWMGSLRSWRDSRYGGYRPVFGIRNGTHGTYAAQDCSGQTSDYDLGIGMWLGSVENYGEFRACIHEYPGHAIIYYPIMEEALTPSLGLPYAEQLPRAQRDGMALYNLEQVSQSALWSQRDVLGMLFSGTQRALPGGHYGYDYFDGITQSAQPPWAWLGGPGEGPLGMYYYSWGVDGTNNSYSQKNWKTAPYGALLGGSGAELVSRFPFLPDVQQPLRFNPYIANQPDYNVPTLTVSISGPTEVVEGQENTWSAVVSGGTGPYTVTWSGGLTGTGSTISGTLSESDLYVDVWDSAGRHAAVATYVRIMQDCPNFQISC